jgi:hypothetical protein
VSRRGGIALAGAALVIAAIVIALTRAGPRRAAPRPATSPLGPAGLRVGASVNRLFNDQTYTPAEIGAQLAALRATGATLARSDALWEATQPFGPDSPYNWRFDDSVAGALAAHGLQWLPIVDYSAPWAQSLPGREHSAPRSDRQYAAYAAALASRYGVRGSFWAAHPDLQAAPVDTFEIWNEPDNPGFWPPAPDAARYGRLYVAARTAIKRVDPSARVIIGGLTAPRTFLPPLLAASPALRKEIDGVAVHPYAPDPAGVADRVRTARTVMRALGLAAVPLYVTEFGWTTSPPGALDYAPARLRPGYIAGTLDALGHSDCTIAQADLYTWVTPERHERLDQDWFGISPPGAGRSSDASAFSDATRAAASPGPVALHCG